MQVGKFLKTINVETKTRPSRMEFFLKINKRAGPIPIHVQDGIKHAGGNFFSKLINVHAHLFGTLE